MFEVGQLKRNSHFGTKLLELLGSFFKGSVQGSKQPDCCEVRPALLTAKMGN